MKSIFIALAAIFSAATVFAVPFSGTTVTDYNKKARDASNHDAIMEYINSVECKTDAQKKSIATLYCRILAHQKMLLPFGEYIAKGKAKIAEMKFEKITPVKELSILIPWTQKVYDASALEYIKAQPFEVQKQYSLTGWYLNRLHEYKEAYGFLLDQPRFIHIAVRIAAVHLKDDAKIFEAASIATKYQLTAANAKIIVKTVCDKLSVSETVKPEAVKELLQKFNRKFTPNLAINKAEWEPIIVQIQIALKTY